jgi:hypothetical protein
MDISILILNQQKSKQYAYQWKYLKKLIFSRAKVVCFKQKQYQMHVMGYKLFIEGGPVMKHLNQWGTELQINKKTDIKEFFIV